MEVIENRILNKLDDLYERQSQMNVILAKQEVHLKEHIARTDALETLVQLHYEELYGEIYPVKKHVYMINGGAKLAAAIFSVLGLAVAIAKLFL